jgi:hypothetical protein
MARGVRIGGAALVLVAALATACGEDSSTDVVNSASGFPAQRCQANRDAGRITFLTSFDYAAAASIIDVVAADGVDTICRGRHSRFIASVAQVKARLADKQKKAA